MNKQEQIEEMAQFICGRSTDDICIIDRTSCDCNCAWARTAEAIYNAGYRKIPENAVVLTKEEYEDLKVAADNYNPFWFCSFGGCEGARKGCKDDCEMGIFVQERKKTAKEILQKMKEKCKELENKFSHICKSQKECLMETCRYEGVLAVKREVYELAKEYGLEVEE